MALGSPGTDLNNKQTTAHRPKTVGQPGARHKNGQRPPVRAPLAR